MALNKTQRFRTGIVAGGIVLAFAAALAHLYKIQCLDHEKYETLARRQHLSKLKIPVRRGRIFDRHRNPLAISLPVHSLYADPEVVKHKSLAAWKLAPVLSMQPQDVFARLIRGRRFTWIKRKLSSEEYGELLKLKIHGTGFRREYRRAYPHGLLLGQVLGFCGIDDKGLAGLEFACEPSLSGQPGYRVTKRDAAGTRIAASGLKREPASNGLDVILTIDTNIQRIVEEELDKACEQWRPQSGVAVVMAPLTGEILALANWPFFDPGTFSQFSPQDLQRLSHNAAVLDVYEPGSTFKPFAVCAALEEQVVTPFTVFDCENGRAVINGRRLRDAHPHGRLTVSKIITFSSNIGVSKVALRLGRRKLYEYVRAFGFGQATGLPVACEPSGLLAPPDRWSKYTITSIPMGQEIAVTSVQLAAGFSAIAAGGKLMKPRLIRSIENPDTGEVVKQFAPQLIRQAVSGETARCVTEMLVSVIENPEGTGRRARLEGYTLAGKTGTAQKCLAGRRGYSSSDYVCSFVAFAPAYEPRVCAVVEIDTPRGSSHYGGTVAAPAVREIIRRTLAYLDVSPNLTRLVRDTSG
jgi:cell division protein FtsI (penicillin-binding protein 3)